MIVIVVVSLLVVGLVLAAGGLWRARRRGLSEYQGGLDALARIHDGPAGEPGPETTVT